MRNWAASRAALDRAAFLVENGVSGEPKDVLCEGISTVQAKERPMAYSVYAGPRVGSIAF